MRGIAPGAVKPALLCLLATFVLSSANGDEPENILKAWAKQYQRNKHAPPPIEVSARLKTTKGKHSLAFRLTNISDSPLTLASGWLPWGYPGGITIAAFTTDGKHLRNFYAGDPSGHFLKLDPGKSLQGDYPLSWGLLDPIPKDKDTVVMWLYTMPAVLSDEPYERWPACTGVVVIPKAK